MICRFTHSQGLVSNQGNRLTRSLLVGAMAFGATVVPLGLSSPAGASSPTISVGSHPHGVAVNPSTNTVYVTNYSGHSVSVINGSNNHVRSTVTVGTNPIGVAVNPSTNTVYVTNVFGDSVSVINGSNNHVKSTVTVGTHPHGVAVNPSTNTVYVTNESGNSVSVINGSTT